jgi:urease beta subunit
MRRYFSHALKLAFLLGSVIPLTSMAQDIKEFYLRPSYWRPYDQRGINVFETTKTPDSIPFEGTRVRLGAGFTQQFQNLKHENKLANNNASINKLYPLTPGFMTSQANLFLDVQLAEGIRLNVTTYLSTRHHNEAWVKGGYIQFDKLPFKGQFWDNLMKYTTVKIGHMEINYGDAHFRRSDGGQTLYNPFMDNLIMDGYATEIGGEVYLQKNGLFGMAGLTNGMIKGNVDSVDATKVADGSTKRAPSIYLKGGIDKALAEKIRVRVSGSFYHNSNSNASGLTLYGGDRTGSNYQNVMEKAPYGTALPASTAIAFSGRFNPGFTKKVDAVMLNGFLKVKGLELFGTYEYAQGYAKTETGSRIAKQLAGDLVYRFGKNENLFVGARYNTVKAEMAGFTKDVTVDRIAGSAGWFLTRNVLLKGELVQQNYKDFPSADYRAGGKFNGYVIEAVVGL